MQTKRKRTNLIIPTLILIFSLALSIFAWRETQELIEHQKQERISGTTEEITIRTEDKLDEYIDILYASRALLIASNGVERSEWQAFISAQNFNERLPGIQALELISRVNLQEKDSFIAGVKSDTSLNPLGYPDFNIYPEGERVEYFVVNYIEPFEENEKAFGFDLASSPDRKEALDKARDTGLPVATAPIKLVQETGEQAGFLIFLAIYEKGMPINTLSERQAALSGFILAVFKADDLFSVLLNNIDAAEEINIEIFDTGDLNEKFKLFSHRHEESSYQPIFSKINSIDIAGREWELHFEESSEFSTSLTERILPLAVLSAGLIFSVLVFSILYSLFRTKDRAVRLAEKMTADLKISKKEAEDKAAELKKANNLMMERELRIIELKEENQELKKGHNKKKKLQNNKSDFYDSNI